MTTAGKPLTIKIGCGIYDQETANQQRSAAGVMSIAGIPTVGGAVLVNGEAIRPRGINKYYGVAILIYRTPEEMPSQMPDDFKSAVISILDHELGHLLRDVPPHQMAGIMRHRERVGAPFGLSDTAWSAEIGEPYQTLNRVTPNRYALTLPDERDANVHAVLSAFDRLDSAAKNRLSYRELIAIAAPQALRHFTSSALYRKKFILSLWRAGVQLRHIW